MATYDPKKIVFTFGNAIIQGYADGTGILIARTTDNWEMEKGMDDATTWTKINNSSGDITLNLQQGSLSNNILTAFYTLDETANLGLLPFLLKDILGLTTVTGIGRIKKIPDLGFANAHTSREWVIGCESMKTVVGGNL